MSDDEPDRWEITDGDDREPEDGGPPRVPGEKVPPPTKPPRGLASEGVRVSSRMYSMVVGAAFLVVVAVAVLNGIGNDSGTVVGVDDELGAPLVEFAIPDARGDLEGDANIAQDDCERGGIPCPADQVRTPACEIETPGAIHVCDLFDMPLVISFWFTRGGDCFSTQDAFDAVSRRWRGRVNFLSINVRDDPDRVREIIAERGWTVPVGHDADGAVSNVYGVAVCPTLQFAAPGGILVDVQIGEIGAEGIDARVGELVAESRRREVEG